MGLCRAAFRGVLGCTRPAGRRLDAAWTARTWGMQAARQRRRAQPREAGCLSAPPTLRGAAARELPTLGILPRTRWDVCADVKQNTGGLTNGQVQRAEVSSLGWLSVPKESHQNLLPCFVLASFTD